ncbi:hypothetical protein SCHPADRAFT_744144 [Schizopora paradoxa]|uniref:Uncharacterized protein n=1 Tax=Schizopora paradoxa TaxID=27342 RepID=A0A0H2QZJ6_9AGAM|nr:hypothetical protein SCHPADRAFT_744144 [Schizopora paradoxa]
MFTNAVHILFTTPRSTSRLLNVHGERCLRGLPAPRLLRHAHNASPLSTTNSSTRVPESSSTCQRGGRSLSLARCQILSTPVGTGRSQLTACARAVGDEAPSLLRAVAVEREGTRMGSRIEGQRGGAARAAKW